MGSCDKEEKRLILEINQGCPRGYDFTILQNDLPMNLLDYNVIAQVKYEPYFNLTPLIEIRTEGREDGTFTLNFTEEDTLKLPPDDYALVVLLEQNGVVTNISGEGNIYSIFRVCYQ